MLARFASHSSTKRTSLIKFRYGFNKSKIQTVHDFQPKLQQPEHVVQNPEDKGKPLDHGPPFKDVGVTKTTLSFDRRVQMISDLYAERQLPLRYKRKPLDDAEILSVNSGGADGDTF